MVFKQRSTSICVVWQTLPSQI